jgi:hypothetical protein
MGCDGYTTLRQSNIAIEHDPFSSLIYLLKVVIFMEYSIHVIVMIIYWYIMEYNMILKY